MSEIVAFFSTVLLSIALILYLGKKRNKPSRYERSAYATTDWQKLDQGIDPTESDKE